MDAALRLWESERALAVTEADRLTALERLWQRAWQIEDLNRERHEAGRIPTKDYLETQYLRLQAERWWAETRNRMKPPLPLSGAILTTNDRLSTKELARVKLQAAEASPRKVAETLLEIANWDFAMRMGPVRAGRGNLVFTEAAARRVLESQLALSDNKADQIAAFERYWLSMKSMEDMIQSRFEVGRVPIEDVFYCKYFRLEGAIGLARVRARKEKPLAPPGGSHAVTNWQNLSIPKTWPMPSSNCLPAIPTNSSEPSWQQLAWFTRPVTRPSTTVAAHWSFYSMRPSVGWNQSLR
jgi:hypothetical protein